MTPALRKDAARAVQVVTRDGTVLRAGRASLFILERIGYPHLARVLRQPPLIWCVEAGYRLVADHRPFFARFLFRGR
jgi:hypothetical protein